MVCALRGNLQIILFKEDIRESKKELGIAFRLGNSRCMKLVAVAMLGRLDIILPSPFLEIPRDVVVLVLKSREIQC